MTILEEINDLKSRGYNISKISDITGYSEATIKVFLDLLDEEE